MAFQTWPWREWIREDQNWSHFEGEQTVEEKGEKRRGKERRRGRGREEEEKPSSKRYGTTWTFKALNGFPCNCMVISCPQT